MKNFKIIVAMDKQNGIGKDGKLPWDLPNELRHFSNVTKNTVEPNKKNAVIMGRKTWESIPKVPLQDRLNIVLTSREDYDLPSEVLKARSLDEALKLCGDDIESIFVTGGGQVFEEAMKNPRCDTMYITLIHEDFDCDTFFPREYENSFRLEATAPEIEEKGLKYRYMVYKRRRKSNM